MMDQAPRLTAEVSRHSKNVVEGFGYAGHCERIVFRAGVSNSICEALYCSRRCMKTNEPIQIWAYEGMRVTYLDRYGVMVLAGHAAAWNATWFTLADRSIRI